MKNHNRTRLSLECLEDRLTPTAYWFNPTASSGTWSNAENWHYSSPTGLVADVSPGTGDTVNMTTSKTCVLDSNKVVADITIDHASAKLQIGNYYLAIDGGSTDGLSFLAGAVEFTHANGNLILADDGNSVWAGTAGFIGGQGRILVQDTHFLSVGETGLKTCYTDLVVQGSDCDVLFDATTDVTVTFGSTGSIGIGRGGTLTLPPLSTKNHWLLFSDTNPSYIGVIGKIDKSGAGTVILGAPLLLTADAIGGGVVDVKAGSFKITPANTGTDLAGIGVLVASGWFTVLTGATVECTGHFELAGELKADHAAAAGGVATLKMIDGSLLIGEDGHLSFGWDDNYDIELYVDGHVIMAGTLHQRVDAAQANANVLNVRWDLALGGHWIVECEDPSEFDPNDSAIPIKAGSISEDFAFAFWTWGETTSLLELAFDETLDDGETLDQIFLYGLES